MGLKATEVIKGLFVVDDASVSRLHDYFRRSLTPQRNTMDTYNLEHIFRSIEEWLQIKRFHRPSRDVGGPVEFTSVDASHSALLRRILEQKKVYKRPPPTSMSYPWYHLMDMGKSDCCVRVDETEKKVSVNQNGHQWELIETIHPGKAYKIQCKTNDMICLVTMKSNSELIDNAEIVILELHDGELVDEKA